MEAGNTCGSWQYGVAGVDGGLALSCSIPRQRTVVPEASRRCRSPQLGQPIHAHERNGSCSVFDPYSIHHGIVF
jgi:hypothetical protein